MAAANLTLVDDEGNLPCAFTCVLDTRHGNVYLREEFFYSAIPLRLRGCIVPLD